MCLHCKRERLRNHFRMEEIKRSNKSVLDLELNLALIKNKCSKSGVPSPWATQQSGGALCLSVLMFSKAVSGMQTEGRK